MLGIIIGIWPSFMAFGMWRIICKLSKLVMIHLISFLINLSIANEFKCFSISAQNSFIIIDAILFAMGYIYPHICNEFPPPNLIKATTTLPSIRMFSFMIIFFSKNLDLKP